MLGQGDDEIDHCGAFCVGQRFETPCVGLFDGINRTHDRRLTPGAMVVPSATGASTCRGLNAKFDHREAVLDCGTALLS
jgi:hypothetical protein